MPIGSGATGNVGRIAAPVRLDPRLAVRSGPFAVDPPAITGSGGVAQSYALAGSGTETFTATGAVAQSYALGGTGTETFTGSGTEALGMALGGSGSVTGGVAVGSRRLAYPFPIVSLPDEEDEILELLEVA